MNDLAVLYFAGYAIYLWFLFRDLVVEWDSERRKGRDNFGVYVFGFLFYGVFLGFLCLPIMALIYLAGKWKK
jgi:hypothetical protein